MCVCVCVCVYIYIYIVHSAGRQFHLNSTNCQSKRATGPYRFPRRCLSPCYGMIAACLQKRQLLLLSEKKKKKKTTFWSTKPCLSSPNVFQSLE